MRIRCEAIRHERKLECNRPFDDQSNFRIRLETEAKLRIQDEIRSGCYHLVWSYILDYENSKNPYQDRREQIAKWRGYALTMILNPARQSCCMPLR